MLRVYLDADNLTKIRFTTDPAPLDEIMMSLRLLRSGPRSGSWGRWRRRARQRLPRAALPLLDLVRYPGCAPALPGGLVPDLEAALELVASAPAAVLRAELATTYPHQRMPLWVRDLARADRDALNLFTGGLRAYYRSCIEPDRPQIRAAVEADVAYRAQIMRHGLGHLLSTLSPSLRWRPPYLELDRGDPQPDTIMLPGGRGLLLMPSVFCSGPLVGTFPDRTLAIAYPTRAPFHPAAGDEPAHSDALHVLLGTTRAGVLQALRCSAHTTTEIARRLRISPSTASEHTTVLRRAGLITTSRQGQSVRHTTTALGDQLLQGLPVDATIQPPAILTATGGAGR